MDLITVENLYKRLGKREIIKDISFSVREGEVFGFLGKNGAGKSTTIRIMAGLISADRGNIKIMGHDVKTDLVKGLEHVGIVFENPDFYLSLTGRENLICFSRMYGKVPEDRLEEIIKLIGLKERINDRVKKYSLGMKQRLGLGQALLCNPKVLILDEPTNGLDPMGIIDFRNIIRKVSKENGTSVFMSSHMLSEIQQVCDRVAIIDNGRILAVEDLDDINSNSKSLMTELEKKFMETIDGGGEKCGN